MTSDKSQKLVTTQYLEIYVRNILQVELPLRSVRLPISKLAVAIACAVDTLQVRFDASCSLEMLSGRKPVYACLFPWSVSVFRVEAL